MQCKQSKNEHILRLDEDDIRWDEGTIGFAAAPSWDPPASSTTTTLYPVAGASFLEWSPPAMAVAASGIENRGRTKNNRDALSDVIRCGSRAASRYISLILARSQAVPAWLPP